MADARAATVRRAAARGRTATVRLWVVAADMVLRGDARYATVATGRPRGGCLDAWDAVPYALVYMHCTRRGLSPQPSMLTPCYLGGLTAPSFMSAAKRTWGVRAVTMTTTTPGVRLPGEPHVHCARRPSFHPGRCTLLHARCCTHLRLRVPPNGIQLVEVRPVLLLLSRRRGCKLFLRRAHHWPRKVAAHRPAVQRPTGGRRHRLDSLNYHGLHLRRRRRQQLANRARQSTLNSPPPVCATLPRREQAGRRSTTGAHLSLLRLQLGQLGVKGTPGHALVLPYLLRQRPSLLAGPRGFGGAGLPERHAATRGERGRAEAAQLDTSARCAPRRSAESTPTR